MFQNFSPFLRPFNKVYLKKKQFTDCLRKRLSNENQFILTFKNYLTSNVVAIKRKERERERERERQRERER